MKRSECENDIFDIDDFDMVYGGIFSGKLKDLKLFKQELNKLAEEYSIIIRYQDINRGKLWIRRDGENGC